MESAVHPELRQFCQDMRADMQDVKTALVGNKYQTGIVQRLDAVERTTAEHGRKFLVWGTILSAAGTALVFLKDFISKPSS